MSTIAVVWWCLGRQGNSGSLEPQQASHLFLGSVPKTRRLPELGAALQGRLCCLRGGTTLKTKVREKYPVHSKQTHYSAWHIATLIHLCATYIISRFSKLLNIDISVKKSTTSWAVIEIVLHWESRYHSQCSHSSKRSDIDHCQQPFSPNKSFGTQEVILNFCWSNRSTHITFAGAVAIFGTLVSTNSFGALCATPSVI